MSIDVEESTRMAPRHFIGISNWPHVMNMANSIIGVSVLALPFCFKECGILLGFLLLMGSAWLAQLTCYLLMKSAFTTKKRSYEYLAFHIFGRTGKLIAELSIIGLLIGTCIAFYIIIGDLGPAVVSKVTGLENTSQLRSFLLISLTIVVVLPLAMLHSLESLSNFSAVSLAFYCVFVAEVIIAAFPNLWSGVWMSKVVFWNAEGVFKCLPIFALSFACQTQLFIMSEALPEPSLNQVNRIVHSAIFMCSIIYVSVGFFGYVAFCDDYISGDILMNFHPTFFSEAIKLGFVTSTLISFPLVIFPCRASLYTLLFVRKGIHENFGGAVYIPTSYFKIITVCIIAVTLTIGLLVPNVEFMLALTGATMGSLICYILPAALFITAISVDSGNTRSFAQLVLLIGVTILLASSYVTLMGPERVKKHDSVVKLGQPIQHHEDDLAIHDDEELKKKLNEMNKDVPDKSKVKLIGPDEMNANFIDGTPKKATKLPVPAIQEVAVNATPVVNNNKPLLPADNKELKKDKRQEPPNPHAPFEESVIQEKVKEINSQGKDLHKNQTKSVKDENGKNSVIHQDDPENPKVRENPPIGLNNATSGVAGVVPLDGNARVVLAEVLQSKDQGIRPPSDPGSKVKSAEDPAAGSNRKSEDVKSEKVVDRKSVLGPEKNLHGGQVHSVDSQSIPEVQPQQQQQRKQVRPNETILPGPKLLHPDDSIPAKILPEVEQKGAEQNEANVLLAELRKQNQEQRKLLDEHRKIIDDLKRHQIEAHQEIAPRQDVNATDQEEKLKLARISPLAVQTNVKSNEKSESGATRQNRSEKEHPKKKRAVPDLEAQSVRAKDDHSLAADVLPLEVEKKHVKLEHSVEEIAEKKNRLEIVGAKIDDRDKDVAQQKNAGQKNISANNKAVLEHASDNAKPLVHIVTLGMENKEILELDKQLFDKPSPRPDGSILNDLP